jgi:DNA-binding NtrC family response regulator
MAEGAAKSPVILITGESGVGKDLVARHIHSQSRRKLAPFVGVNCAGLTEARLESELFGHHNGNMIGARPEKRGKLQLAHRGTLFLDEVGDMIGRMQLWLLRFLGRARPLARRIAGACRRAGGRATHRNLNDLVAAAAREIFCTGCASSTSACRRSERAEDVHALMQHFLAVAGRDLNFTDDALRALRNHGWPGNVRELRNVVEQLVWLSAGGVVGIEHLPVSMRSGLALCLP